MQPFGRMARFAGGAPGGGRCAGRGPGQEPDCARRPLSAGTPALRGQARPTRNPRAVTDPHPAHTRDTYGGCRQVHEGLVTWARAGNGGAHNSRLTYISVF